MAEALLFAANNTHPDPEKDRRGAWKRGYIVVVKPDGHVWGSREDPARNAAPRKFVLIKFPGVSVERVERYLQPQFDDAGGALLEPVVWRRRLWQIQYSELPLAARNKLATEGVLIIGGASVPNADYTWAQVRNFFMRLDDNTRESGAL